VPRGVTLRRRRRAGSAGERHRLRRAAVVRQRREVRIDDRRAVAGCIAELPVVSAAEAAAGAISAAPAPSCR